MRHSSKITAGAMALTFAVWLTPNVQAQPMYDRIHVNLPYTITMQNKTLQPGDYTIQQLPSTGGSSRVLLFYTNDGMKFETSAMTIPALDINTARDTKLVLNHVGEDYYISKIWVQGKDYGYELPMPDSMKSRQNERMIEATVPATSQPSSSTDMVTKTTTASAASPETTPPANPNDNSADTANRAVAEPTANAQNTQPASTDNSADRAIADQEPPHSSAADNTSANRDTMPSTSAGWLTLLLSGSTLSGAGLMLRRKR